MPSLCERVIKETHSAICRTIRRIVEREAGGRPPSLLDIGCWDGTATVEYARAGGMPLEVVCGVDVDQVAVEKAKLLFECHRVDLERECLPFPDHSFHIVICNQVLEHLKNIYRPMTEAWRVTKPGGALIVSVPNLAALHNRVLLLAGFQPTSIRLFGPHVRGITLRELIRFATFNGLFRLEGVLGVGWHPLPANSWLARWLAHLFPGAAHTVVLVLRKTMSEAARTSDWEDWLAGQNLQTNY